MVPKILTIFIVLKIIQQLAERWLASLNRKYYLNKEKQAEAKKFFNIDDADFSKTLSYTEDKYRFASWSSWVSLILTLAFLALGGMGLVETWSQHLGNMVASGSSIVTGLFFFFILILLSMVVGIPFELYSTFKIEEKHGFNRQTVGGFFLDKLKGLFLGVILGGLLLSGLLYVMEKTGDSWWLWAWGVMSGFSLFASWIFPSVLAPMFNKFTKIEDGELKESIYAFSKKIGFKTGGLYVMDASKRSSHGNAYFTGVFGEKRIVLFDTLVKSLSVDELVAVLAHELGHFVLHHVRWGLVRGILLTGLMFYAMSLCLSYESFYTAFYLKGMSSYGALVVFGMWFGFFDFILQPLGNWMSRKNEFAADDFAKKNIGSGKLLVDALIKMRESNYSMPISHPIYSSMYYSHPPLMERLAVLKG